METNVKPDKGWQTDDLFVPPGFEIDTKVTKEDKTNHGEAGDQPFAYPMGVGGLIMNGCFGRDYQSGDPCYEATWKTTICLVSIPSLKTSTRKMRFQINMGPLLVTIFIVMSNTLHSGKNQLADKLFGLVANMKL